MPGLELLSTSFGDSGRTICGRMGIHYLKLTRMKRIIRWFLAADVDNDMGAAYLVAPFRIMFVIMILIGGIKAYLEFS